MTSPIRKPSLDEVLDEFFFSADNPATNKVLSACKAHPEYRADILEFAALWTAYEAAPEAESDIVVDEAVSEVSVSRLQSFVLNRVHELDQVSAQPDDLEAAKLTITGLSGARLRRATAAAELGSSTVLLHKILSKRIVDVPSSVLSSLAHHLNLASVVLQEALFGKVVGGISYSAPHQPDAPVSETWESAVRSLAVSDEEKMRLLALQKKDGTL